MLINETSQFAASYFHRPIAVQLTFADVVAAAASIILTVTPVVV